ncbi:MAG: hypothetical protein R6X13_01950 [bacterium]
MTKWEYKFQQIDLNISPILRMARWGVEVPGEKKPRTTMVGVEDHINTLGAEGWELVSVVAGSEHTGIITRAVLFFRRARPGSAE